jgi:hypothetical protein
VTVERPVNAGLPVQVDVGMADAVVPEPDWLEHQELRDDPVSGGELHF